MTKTPRQYLLLSAIFLSWLFICGTTVFAQKNKTQIDSLEKLASFQKDSSLVLTYNELTWQYRLVNRDKAIIYGNKAIETGTRLHFLRGIAQAYNDLGIIYFDKENYDTAIILYIKAIGLRKKINDEKGIAKLYNKIGIVYQKQGYFDKALEQQFAALAIFEKWEDDIGISYSLNNIGILQQNLGRYDDALQFLHKSIVIKEKIGDKYGLAGSYVNIGNIYVIQKNFTQSETYYQKAVSISRVLGDKEYLSNALNNLGTQYITSGQPDKALPLIYESLALRDSLGDTKGKASCMNNLGEIFLQKKMYDSAGNIISRAVTMAKNVSNCKPEMNKLFLTLSKVYEAQGDPVRALEAFKLYAQTKDSLFTDNLGQRFAELDIKYKSLEKENIIQQQKFEIAKKNYLIISTAALFILLSLLGYSYYRRYKLKHEKRLQAEITRQQDLATQSILAAEENERKRIAAELHDGIGQMMSAARMNLSAFEGSITFKDEDQKKSYEKVIGIVDESCREVRNISHQMMPNALLKRGLSEAIKDFLDKIDSRILKINLYTEGLNERLDSNTETILYRVIQECVNNVIKHSGANILDISLVKDEDGIAATIEDNGKGFDTRSRPNFEGIGLKNIKSRIEYLKGRVEFDSQPGKGTLVAIHVPLNK